MDDTTHPMLESVTRVCRQRRRLLEHTQADLADRAGLARTAIVAFEAARTWPRDADRLVAAYADDELDAARLWLTAAQNLAEGSSS